MKKIVLLVVFFFMSIFFLHAQSEKIKSVELLRERLKKEKNIDSIILLNNKIAIELKNNNAVDEALLVLRKTIKFSKNNNNINGLGGSYLVLTNIYLYGADLDSATYYNNKAIESFQKTKSYKNIAKAYLHKSIIFQSKSDFKNQLKYALISLEFSEKSKDFALVSNNYNNLAMYALDQHKYEDALKYAKKSYKYALISKNIQSINNSYTGLAESYSSVNDTINANKIFKIGYEFSKKRNDSFATAWFLTNWARLQKTREALKMRLEAQKIWNKFGENAMQVHNTGMIGILYMKLYNEEKNAIQKQNYLKKAEKYLTKTIENAYDNDDIMNSIEFNKSLSKLYQIKKEYDKAYLHLEKSTVLNDSINSQEIKNSLAKLESQKEIEIKNNQLKINQLELQAKEKQKWFYLFGIGLLAIIGGLLFYQSRNRKKTNQKLQLLNTELDQANKTKTRFFSILNHDLRSPVANLIHFLHLQKDSPELLDEETKNRMQNKTISGAEDLLSSMEDILLWSKGQMENFKPQPKEVSVNQLFEDTKKVFSGYHKIQFDYQNPDNIAISTDENYLKTIIRNLTSNAINVFTTTQNPKIIWKAWQENGISYLSITDNGPGATKEKFKALYDDKEVAGIKTGLGLHLIRDLAKAINCEITVNSQINKGTTFILSL
jgi:signal transduction histidine kinase